ncbi:MAG: ArsR family transcriptional regulator [Leptospiraceae bacterium]|nr:ArsR family transcriptional regulator [Leptospiraceae bacterium]
MKILKSFMRRPERDRSVGEISRMLSIRPRSASYNLRKLTVNGVLCSTGKTKSRRYKLIEK